MMYLVITLAITAMFFGVSYIKGHLKFTLIWSGIVFGLAGAINYFAMPVLNVLYPGLWVEAALILGLGCLLYNGQISDLREEARRGRSCFFPRRDDEEEKVKSVWWWRISLTAVPFAVLVILGSVSSEMMNASKYNKMLDVQQVEYKNFASDVDVIPVEKMIVADYDLARKVVEDRLEEDPGLGSRCEVGRMTLQNLSGSFVINGGKKLTFDNEPVWVAPLEHNSFWKWVSNDFTPGYMLVYAKDPTQNYLITEVNGVPLKMRYIESGYFGDDIERHIKTNGYYTQGVTEHNFEIDPDGQPYWVLCNYAPTIGMGGYDAKGVITVDIQSGALRQYTLENAPEWIDHIQPESFVADQVRYWGEYKLGWWNSCFSQQDVQLPTPGMVLVYSNGQSYWYTGVRSAGGDTATSGFMLINSRTKEAKYYRVSGVNEEEAQRIVEDQNFAKAANYRATAPVLYNVRGIPTYFMTLKGASGNVTGYAFMAVTNRQAVGVGTSKREAERNFLQALQRSTSDVLQDGAVQSLELQTLTVKDIMHENNTYYIIFNEISGQEFTASSEFFPELRWTKPSHRVQVSYNEGESSLIPLEKFDNMDFTL